MNLKLCITLPQYWACIVYALFFLHVLIVTYSSTHTVCYDVWLGEDPGKVQFVTQNEGKNRPVWTNFAGSRRLGDNKSACNGRRKKDLVNKRRVHRAKFELNAGGV